MDKAFAPVKLAGEREGAAWLAHRRRCFVVEGDSMLPVLVDGDEVLVAPERAVATGDIVVFKHPFVMDCFLVKRVESICGQRLFLVGDNPKESTDSRSFGAIRSDAVIGPVTSNLPPATPGQG